MRILYFSEGYTVHDRRFLTTARKAGHEVRHLQLRRFRPGGEPVPPEGVPMGSLGGHRLCPWPDRLRLHAFRRVLLRVRPDIVHAGPVPTCGFLAALSGFHPLLLMSWGSDILVQAERGPIGRGLTRLALRRADGIVCDCRAVRDRLTERWGYPAECITVFPWGVDLDRFHPAPSALGLRRRFGWEGKPVVIHTRSFERIYGIETLLETIRIAAGRNPELRFILAGDGSLRPMIQRFLARHRLEGTVHLAGRVPHESLPDYFNESDLYLSCSLSDGSSVSLLEAMACGLPAVVSDLDANREWVQAGVNGRLFPRGDALAAAEAVLSIAGDRAERERMGAAGVAQARERADWEKNSRKLLETYERFFAECRRKGEGTA